MTMITGIRLPNTKTTPVWRTILKSLQNESIDQGSWPLHRTQSEGKHIYTISKMVVGLDKQKLITTEVEEWSRQRGEREPEDRKCICYNKKSEM